MSQPYVGEIRCFGFTFAPRDWALCNGQTMQIAQNSTLYAILGTTYGGDGQTTFALPNLQGQIPMHWGRGVSGLTTTIGEPQGTSSVTLSMLEMPAHVHTITAVDPGNVANRFAAPSQSSYLSAVKGSFGYQKAPVTANAPFAPTAISAAGNSLPHDNMQPYLTINFSISLFGIFPQRQ
jgi:microcystin-dependent protein